MNVESIKELVRKLKQSGFEIKWQEAFDSSNGHTYDHILGFERNKVIHGLLDPSVCQALGEAITKQTAGEMLMFYKASLKDAVASTVEAKSVTGEETPLLEEKEEPVQSESSSVEEDYIVELEVAPDPVIEAKTDKWSNKNKKK